MKQIPESYITNNSMDEKVVRARVFVLEVARLAEKYGLNYFVVTDGASGISNSGNAAVEHARQCHIEWEKANGIDPEHDWSGSSHGE